MPCCVGCWQEVRYEPSELTEPTRQIAGAEPAQPIMEAATTPSAEVAVEPEAPLEEVAANPEPSVPTTIEPETSAVEPASDRPMVADTKIETDDPFAENNEQTSDASSNVEEADLRLAAQPEVDTQVSARTALATWQMSSDWSMAAALQAKGRGEDIYGERLVRAADAALSLGVTLPKLPEYESENDRLQGNLNFLLEAAGPQLASELNEQHNARHAALAELATKSHVLLLSYTPNSPRLDAIIKTIRQTAENSGLPENVWGELVNLLMEQAEFKQVKAAIFRLHRQATDSLESRIEQP